MRRFIRETANDVQCNEIPNVSKRTSKQKPKDGEEEVKEDDVEEKNTHTHEERH